MASYRYDKLSGKVISVEEWYQLHGNHVGNSAMVMKSFEPFKSTIDGTIINDRRQLAEHNKKHGVTNIADYGEKYFSDAGKRMYNEKIGNTPQAEKERRALLTENLKRAGVKL